MDRTEMQAFENFVESLELINVIRIGHHISELTGKGTEYLVINGEIVAKFYNGMLPSVASCDPNEATLIPMRLN
jgi:hypothetical protein